MKLMAADDTPVHSVWLAVEFTVGVGFTVSVKVADVPPQALADGVTVMVATNTEAPALVEVNVPIFPVPDEARPIEVLLLVHV